MTALPVAHTPEQVAEQLGVSPRRLRELARKVGAYRQLGATMFFTDDDVKALLEAMKPCPSTPINAAKSGTTGARLLEGGYEALRALRTKQPRSASSPKGRREPGKVISMAQRRS